MPEWMMANRTGLILGVFVAAVLTLPVAGALAVTGGAMMGGGWGERVGGTPGLVMGIVLGFSSVVCVVLAMASLAGAVAGSLVEFVVRKILRVLTR